MQTNRNYWFILSFVPYLFYSCLTAGTHGAIKQYCYAMPIYELRSTIKNIQKFQSNIFPDTVLDQIHIVDSGKNKIILNNQYNDGVEYFSFDIKTKRDSAHYVIHISQPNGIDSNEQSRMSLIYAYSWRGIGGSDAHGLTKLDVPIRGQLINLFDSTFVQRLDMLAPRKKCDVSQ